MDDEEIEQLISELRELLFRRGFGWAAVDAEESLYPTVTRRTRALALISAVEYVTVDLAAVEMRVSDVFGGEDVRFKPDEAYSDDGGEALDLTGRRTADFEAEPISGPQRRAALADLSARRQAFTILRSRLDGLI